MKLAGATLPRGVELVALSALVAVTTALLIGDFGVRLATSTADDSPALLARYLVDPAPFRGDILESFATVYGLGTIVHWGPALLLRWLHVAPETASLVLAYVQNILLAVGIWLLARAAGAERGVAWTAALFALAAEVYLWNLANYRSQMQVPYAGHLVLPFITLAAAALLFQRDVVMTLTLTLAALVHPTVTLLVLPPFALVLLTRPSASNRHEITTRTILRTLLLFAPPFVAALDVALLVRTMSPEPLPAAELLQAMRANVHMNPLGTTRFGSVLLPAYGGFLVLLALALRQRTLSAMYRRLLLATCAATALYALLHIVALRIGSTLLITLVPLRFTMLLALLAVPAIATLLIDTLRTASFAARWAAAAIFAVLPLYSLALHWPVLLALALVVLVPANAPQRRSAEQAALVVLVLWAAASAVVAVGAALPAPLAAGLALLTAGSGQLAQAMAGAIVLAALLALLLRTPARRHQAAIMVAALCAVMLLVRNAAKGATTRDSYDRDLYEAQRWAHTHSPAQAVFIIEPNVPWRVVAQRRAVPLWPNDAHVYSGSRAAFDYARDVRAHATRAPLTDAAAIESFRDRFGGDYLLREIERPAPYAPVFRNDHFAIYRLPARSSFAR